VPGGNGNAVHMRFL